MTTAPIAEAPTRLHAVVLVTDEDDGDRALCRRVLEWSGNRVVEAADAEEAVAKMREDPPDVILLAASQAGMDVLDHMRQARAVSGTRDVPIILTGARPDRKDRPPVLHEGVDEYLCKPLNPLAVISRVRTMVRLRRIELELSRSNEMRGEQARATILLLEFSQNIAAAEDLDTVLQLTVDVVAELTCCRRVSIMLPDAGGNYLTIAKSMGMNGDTTDVRTPVGTGVAGKVFLTGEQIIANAKKVHGDHGTAYESAHFISTPLVSKGMGTSDRVVGVLNVTEGQEKKSFAAHVLGYLELVCNIAASAITNVASRQARDDAYDSIVVALGTLAEYRDSDTGKHLQRVTAFTLILAEDLRGTEQFRGQIDEPFLEDLRRAVPLHDIGKVATPDSILMKAGRLTAEEMVIMRAHAQRGAESIRSVLERAPKVQFLEIAEQIARSHHEWYDGAGYPEGLVGNDIPLAARIAALADVYDALTTKRIYKEAMPHAAAVATIREASGTQFDPAVVEAFLSHEDEFAALAAELSDDAQPRGGDRTCTPLEATAS